ncbi:MAG TPA: substrate-binding domain-containing protein [Dehalococcoidia bacterium]|nr:substrate-binding domain-containing protein [Dehalococcoidia bacterium]
MRARALLLSSATLLVAAALAASCRGDGGRDVILATTTSTVDSGLLDALVPVFERQTGYHLKYVGVGSGAALAMAERGDADAVLSHAPDAERELVDKGVVVNRRLVMHNDFVLVGPSDDPAGVRNAGSATAALLAIARSGSTFISRGDNSGTHQLELRLWERAGFDPTSDAAYVESGQGMGQTLQLASARRAYTLTDRGTFLALRDTLDLQPLLEGDPALLNVYHVMQVNPDRFPGVNAEGARAWVEFLVSDEAQRIIGSFGVDRFGQALFTPDAGKSEAALGLE